MLRCWRVTVLLICVSSLVSSCARDNADSLTTMNPAAEVTMLAATPAPLRVPAPRSVEDALREESTASSAVQSPADPAAEAKPAPIGSSGHDPAKPAIEIYRAGLEKLLESQDNFRATLQEEGMTDGQIDTYFTCIVQETHAKMSAGFLNSVAPGRIGESTLSEEDEDVLDKAITHCSDLW